MLQVIEAALNDPADQTIIRLIFANTKESDILLQSRIDGLVKRYSNRFNVTYVLSNPPVHWNGETGFVSRDMIQKYLPAPSASTLIYVCGPPGMMNAISGNKAPDFSQGPLSGALKDLGYSGNYSRHIPNNMFLRQVAHFLLSLHYHCYRIKRVQILRLIATKNLTDVLKLIS